MDDCFKKISQVLQNSPAEDAGIKEQDIVVSINGRPVSNSSQLKNIVSSLRPSSIAEFIIAPGGISTFKYLNPIKTLSV